MTFQQIIESIEALPDEEQERLFKLLRKRRIEARRSEIAANAQEVLESVKAGTAQRGNFEEMKAYLLSDEDE